MIKSNVNKEQIKFQINEKKKIFSIDNYYSIVTNISDHWMEEDSLVIEITLTNYQKSYLKITLFENSSLNLKYHQNYWPENRYSDSVLNKIKTNKIKFTENDEHLVIELNNQKTLKLFKKKFRLQILEKNGNVVTETHSRFGYDFLEGYISPPLGFKQVENEIKYPFLSLELKNDELIYGLGEKFRPFLKNGIESSIFNIDPSSTCNHDFAYGAVPFMISNKGWGMLVNTGYKSTFEIGSPVTDSIALTNDDKFLDLFIFIGENMKQVISQYTDFTGKISGVPDEAYGIWLNRLYYHNHDELFKEIKNSKSNNYPVDVITLDPKWIKNRFTKTCNFEYNEKAFGDFKTLLKEVHSFDMKMCFWINPYFQMDNSDKSKFVKSEKLLVSSSREGDNFAHPWSGVDKHIEGAGLIDFTNPKANKWFKDEVKILLENGVDFIKTDYGDGLPEEATMFNGCEGREFKQWYSYEYLKATYEATEEYFGPGKGFVLSRPAYIGTNKFVGKWGGDSIQSFNELKLNLSAGLSLSLNGNVMWGTDIGGFQNSNKSEKDLYSRWTAFGMFTPFTRYHGIGPREPWYFSEEELNISRKFAKLKRTLLPYFKMIEKDSIEQGLPIMRPMVLEFEDDYIASKIDDQYMLGDSLLVAPIFIDKARKRQVYLPKGDWFNFFTKEKYEGNKTYNLSCEIAEILVFVKSGSIIPQIHNSEFVFNNLENEEIIYTKYGEISDKSIIEFKLGNKDIKSKVSKLELKIVK